MPCISFCQDESKVCHKIIIFLPKQLKKEMSFCRTWHRCCPVLFTCEILNWQFCIFKVSGAVQRSSPIASRVPQPPFQKQHGGIGTLTWAFSSLSAYSEVSGITKACKRLKMSDPDTTETSDVERCPGDSGQPERTEHSKFRYSLNTKRKRVLNDEESNMMVILETSEPKVMRRLCDDLTDALPVNDEPVPGTAIPATDPALCGNGRSFCVKHLIPAAAVSIVLFAFQMNHLQEVGSHRHPTALKRKRWTSARKHRRGIRTRNLAAGKRSTVAASGWLRKTDHLLCQS